MFTRLANFVVVRRRAALGFTAALVLVAGVIGVGAIERLAGAGFDDPDAESVAARAELDRIFDTGFTDAAIIATYPESRGGNEVDRDDATADGIALTEEIAAIEGTDDVISYWTTGSSELRSLNGRSALILLRLPGAPSDHDRELVAQELLDTYTNASFGVLDVQIGGRDPVFEQISHQAENDFALAEAIAIPLTLLLLLVIFRSVVAALIPTIVGISTIVGALLVLFLITTVADVSVFALNLVTTLGLGLAVDYSLLIVSRYREERDGGLSVDDAVRRTVLTAGRTIAFSGLTVAISLSALLVFPIYFLRSFAYAGIGVIAFALLLSLVAVPAALGLLGDRLEALSFAPRRKRRHGISVWREQADKVVDHPWPYLIVGVVVLAAMAAPFLGVKWGESDHRALPAADPVRVATERMTTEFSTSELNNFPVIATGNVTPGGVTSHAIALSQVDGVTRVDTATGSFIDGASIVPADDATRARFLAEDADAAWFNVVLAIEPIGPEGEALVNGVRAMDSPFDQVLVGGATAALIDTKAAILDNIWLAAVLLFGATYILLFMMFGSLLVPLKAIVLNLLSLGATFGLMVIVFQQGAGADLLGFTETGFTDLSTPILIFGIAFGLSMDYEVFLLARIKEDYDERGHNEDAIVEGIDKTGPIITYAAMLLTITFLAMLTSGLSLLKLFGLGLAVAVVVDAFIVRITVVPALMSVAGSANWWAPAPLRRFHDRWGLTEGDTGAVIDLRDEAIDLRTETEQLVPEEQPAAT